MNQETFEFLEQAAEKGTWAFFSMELYVDTHRPEAGSYITVTWKIEQLQLANDHREGGILIISSQDGDERRAVPPIGNLNLHIGIHPIVIELQSHGERKRTTIKPRLIIPEITLQPPPRVVLDEEATIAWTARNATRCFIQVQNGDELIRTEEVPAAGQMNFVARKLQPISIKLQAKSRHEHLSARAVRVETITLEPEVSIPEIHIGPANRMVAGEVGKITWNINKGERCFLEARNSGHILFQGEIPVAGQLDIIPRELKPIDIQVLALSRHAHLSDKARSSLTTSITVFAPPVNIIIGGSETKTGFLGDEVMFNWRITGASRAYLKAKDRKELCNVSMIGGIAVEVMMEPEAFELIAVGLDGVEHKRHLNVIPRLADLDYMPSDFSILQNANWEV